MSTSDTENLTLYKIPLLYNGGRYLPYLDNSRTMSDFLQSSYVQASQNYSTLTYKELYKPIYLKEIIADVMEYNYGKLTMGDSGNGQSFTFYFFIDNITTTHSGTTQIEYTIDCWSTMKNKIKMTNAYVHRSSYKPNYTRQPYVPLLPTIETSVLYSALGGQTWIGFVYIYQDPDDLDAPSEMALGLMPIYGYTAALKYIQRGTWQELFGIPDGDILSVFAVPIIVSNDDFIDQVLTRFEVVEVQVGQSTYRYYTTAGTYVPQFGFTLHYNFADMYQYQHINSLKTTDTETQGLLDWKGNKIYECPYGYEISRITASYEFSPSGCQIRIAPSISSTNTDEVIGAELNDTAQTYICKNFALFIDQGSEYTWREKDYDLMLRHNQADERTWTAVSDAVQGIGFGFAFGQEKGGAAAGLGGLINVGSTYFQGHYYAEKFNELETYKYQKMADILSVVGDSCDKLFDSLSVYIYKLKVDTASKNRIDKDISINGYYCDEMTDDLEDYFAIGNVIQATDITIEGAIPTNYRQQITDRFSNGVEFI